MLILTWCYGAGQEGEAGAERIWAVQSYDADAGQIRTHAHWAPSKATQPCLHHKVAGLQSSLAASSACRAHLLLLLWFFYAAPRECQCQLHQQAITCTFAEYFGLFKTLFAVSDGMQNFLSSSGRGEGDIAAIVNGFKQGLQKQTVATLNFAEFIQCYQWLLKTLHLMDQAQERYELPRANSMRGLSTSSSISDVSPQKLPQNGVWVYDNIMHLTVTLHTFTIITKQICTQLAFPFLRGQLIDCKLHRLLSRAQSYICMYIYIYNICAQLITWVHWP